MDYSYLHNNPIEYKLSVLILTVQGREESLGKLLRELYRQSSGKSVQILYLGDNKSLTVGEKRNKLLSICHGKYVSFVDDDDMIEEGYIDEILKAIELNPEVITFRVQKYFNGKKEKEQRFSHEYQMNWLSPCRTHYKMSPNHLCAWRREIIDSWFPSKNLKEDHNWSEEMVMKIKSSHNIDKILYSYLYSKLNSETH